jgi:hypothetical protein
LATQIELLATVQLVDQSLRAKTAEVAESERRVAEREQTIRERNLATTSANTELAGLVARRRDLEARLAAGEAKLRDRRMRITRIRNDKELGLAKREIDLLKEETDTVETELLGLMELVDAATAKSRELEGELAALTAERDAEAGRIRERLADLAAEIERERATRAELIRTVDGELRRRYETIFSRRGGLAVVEVREGICQGCRMRVPPQLFNEIQRNDQVILCPSCQRMLYWRAISDETDA